MTLMFFCQLLSLTTKHIAERLFLSPIKEPLSGNDDLLRDKKVLIWSFLDRRSEKFVEEIEASRG
jgi:hypothetical protein